MYQLAFENVTERYGHEVVLNDLTFTVEPGRVTGFLGPNGAGKSTAMKILLDLAKAEHGRATIDGKRYRERPDPARAVGVCSNRTRSTLVAVGATTCGSWPMERASFPVSTLSSLEQTGTSVRTDVPDQLTQLLCAAGATVHTGVEGELACRGIGIAEIGDRACAAGIALHELAAQAGSLEERFLAWTRDRAAEDPETVAEAPTEKATALL